VVKGFTTVVEHDAIDIFDAVLRARDPARRTKVDNVYMAQMEGLI